MPLFKIDNAKVEMMQTLFKLHWVKIAWFAIKCASMFTSAVGI